MQSKRTLQEWLNNPKGRRELIGCTGFSVDGWGFNLHGEPYYCFGNIGGIHMPEGTEMIVTSFSGSLDYLKIKNPLLDPIWPYKEETSEKYCITSSWNHIYNFKSIGKPLGGVYNKQIAINPMKTSILSKILKTKLI